MNDLIRLLREENHSLVISNGGIYSFDGKGIGDLCRIHLEHPSLLHGAQVADKIIGKAAAAFMIQGKVQEVFGEVVTSSAIALFRQYGVKIHYGQKVPYIINRTQDGWCPMEQACRDLESPEEICCIIQQRMESMPSFHASLKSNDGV